MKLIEISLFTLMTVSCSQEQNKTERSQEALPHIETKEVMSDHPYDFITPNGIRGEIPSI